MSWALVEVEEGIAQVDSSADVTLLSIDWDDVADNIDGGAWAIERIDTALTGGFPREQAERLLCRIHTIWPELKEQ